MDDQRDTLPSDLANDIDPKYNTFGYLFVKQNRVADTVCFIQEL